MIPKEPAALNPLDEAIRVGCFAADVHLICSWPKCQCTQIPKAIKAALSHNPVGEGEMREILADVCKGSEYEAPLRGGGKLFFWQELALAAISELPRRVGATPDRESVIEEIAAERKRQVEVEGWTPEHDAEHWQGELAAAASVYALAGSISDADIEGSIRGCHPLGRTDIEVADAIKAFWPWDWKWWKPKDRRRNLVKAGALIVAEIERLDRLTPTPPAGKDKR
jgi:hypothetical protein